FVLRDRPSQNERQRDHADLRDVGAPIELRRGDRHRQRNAKLLPVALRRVAELPQRRTEDMFDDYEIAVRCDDDALGGEGAMTDVGCIAVQFRHRAEELLDEIEGGLDVERQQVLLRDREHPRQSYARYGLGDDRQLGAVRHMLEIEHARKAFTAHMGAAVDAFPDQELEGWNRREGVA